MRVLILNGSARVIGNTGNIVGDLIDELEKEGIEVLQVPMYEYHFTPCNDCRTCEMRGDGRCMDEEDGTNEILSVMREADMIILAAPAYAGNVPAVMRMFLEKASLILEKGDKGLHGKYGAAITVSEHDGAESAYQQLVFWMLRCEMLVVGNRPFPIFRALNSPQYENDELAMRGLKNLISHIVEISEKIE